MHSIYRRQRADDLGARSLTTPDDEEAHVWFFPLANDLDLRGASDCLSEEERARAGRFVRPDDARRYVRSRRALRTLLAAYASAVPEAVALSTGRWGKPSLLGGFGIEFNLSHTASWLMIGVGRHALGVDCEWTGSAPDTAELAPIIRHPNESPVEGVAFFRLWCRKEAALKAWGVGLSISPQTIEVERQTSVRHPEHPELELHDLEAPPEHLAALAVSRPLRRLEVAFCD